MRSRKEIKADFERTFPLNQEEQMSFQRQKLLLEAILSLHDIFENRLVEYLKKLIETLEKR